MSEMNTKLLQIISYFGVNNQQRKIQEELFELQESIIELETSKIRDYEEKLKHVIEELADVEVLLREFILEYGISYEDLILTMKSKVDRTIKRIKEGYYE
jgi:NTP pyrophosphatase (non-canonical NTP hydrolase)